MLLLQKEFSVQIVRKVIANISEQFGGATSPDYGVVKIREKEFSITRSAIHASYGIDSLQNFQGESNFQIIVHTLSRNNRSCWGNQSLLSTDLSTKFSLLFSIAIKNWFPNMHRGSVSKQIGQVFYDIGNKNKVEIGQINFYKLLFTVVHQRKPIIQLASLV